ncbi:MAG: endonuclease MutS2 [Dehalococcoidales bacterium]|nr:endonuclease MutS2 [Dehalococcoidales bacterium]
MDNKGQEILEFSRIQEIIAGFTSFSASHELATNLQPISDYESILLLLNQSAEARYLLAREADFSIGSITDIREAVNTAGRGKTLEPPVLVKIQQTLAATRQLRHNLSQFSTELPRLWDIAGGISQLPQLERAIAKCIAPDGELLDSASAKLTSIRHQLREQRHQLLHRMDTIIRSALARQAIQEPVITEREGRYVIPIKSAARKEITGIIHDVSNTGATVFVEPWEVVELGNELRQLITEEKHEIDRILCALSGKVGDQQAEISANIALSATLDLALAKAKYARQVNATEVSLIAPGSQARVLKLIHARHPLLGNQAVPLSVEIGRDFSILVITGPNTGGKTVTLKTIGLLSLMTQAGLPIPASPDSCLPVFDNIFADIGDEQSIEQTLSTFSWHTGNIIHITGNATPESLVLLDELGTSTDPAEGSALACSTLNYFRQRGIMTIATTHYGELKAFAHITPGLQNASLDFDAATLTPTYHLTVGIPGGSNALATAARLGLPPEIITGAREMITTDTRKLATLITDLAEEKKKLETLRGELEKGKSQAEKHNAELSAELHQLSIERQQVIQQTRDEIAREASQLQQEIRQAAAELRQQKSRERVEQTRRALEVVREKLNSQAWKPKPDVKDVETKEISKSIKVGDIVWLKEAGLQVKVLTVSETTGEVEVQSGSTRFSLSLNRIEKITPTLSEAAKPTPITRQITRQVVSAKLDLRGKRADEVAPALDSYLNNASLANLGEICIVHGMATGTVRSIVRDSLTSHPLVKSFRPGERGEGGDGVTIVRL